VPRADVVATKRPEGGTDIVVRVVVCAAMMETGCFVGAGAGLRGGEEGGGPDGVGGVQGGRWTSWTWPIWRPGIASKVEYAAVAIASRPKDKKHEHEKHIAGLVGAHLSGFRECPTRPLELHFLRS
jgi:hypothetical protein